jgi:AraC-like DNA-binding protein
MDGRIYHIKQLLFQDLGRSWSVEDLAAEVELSVPHFHRLFKYVMRVTPKAYLDNLRMEKASQLLADPNCFVQIKQISIQTGFTNDSHFAREFRKKFRMSPTEFRMQCREIAQTSALNEQE